MTTSTYHPNLPTPFHPLRMALPAFPVRIPRPERSGMSRRELRELVAEMLG